MGTSRKELFLRLGIAVPDHPQLHKRTIQAWHDLELSRMNTGRFRSSFWGGSFPALERPCGRAAMYSLMNLPAVEPAHPKLAATSGAGSDVERQITYRWGRAGITLGGSVPLEERWPEEQLRLQDPRYWLSAAIDSVLDLRPDWPAVVPVDIKSKAPDKIDEMRLGQLDYEPRHRAQVICYIHICRLYHEEMGWADLGLEPARGGFIYYVSRNDPSRGKEFWIEYDEAEVETALETLAEWQQSFIAGKLPERPKAWHWTKLPCQWCDFKKMCKADYQAGVEELADSCTVEYATGASSSYDLQQIREKVLKRWEDAA